MADFTGLIDRCRWQDPLGIYLFALRFLVIAVILLALVPALAVPSTGRLSVPQSDDVRLKRE